MKHLLLYCDGEEPAKDENNRPIHWKNIIPKLDGTVIVNFVMLAEQGNKKLFYCLLDENDPDFDRIKNWVASNKDSLNMKWWIGNTAKEAWIDVFKDRGTDAVANAMIQNLIKYPVVVMEEGIEITKFVPIKNVAGLGSSVNWSYYNTKESNIDAILPHKFFDGSK